MNSELYSHTMMKNSSLQLSTLLGMVSLTLRHKSIRLKHRELIRLLTETKTDLLFSLNCVSSIPL